MKPYYLWENPNINGSLRWEQNSILRESTFKLSNVIEFLNSLESLLRPLCFYCVHYWLSKATMAACDCLTWPDAFYFFFFGGGAFLLNTWINYCYIAITPFNLAWILNHEWCFIYLVSNEPKISIVHLSVFNFFTERKIFSAVALIEIKALYLYYVFYIKFHSFLPLVMKL